MNVEDRDEREQLPTASGARQTRRTMLRLGSAVGVAAVLGFTAVGGADARHGQSDDTTDDTHDTHDTDDTRDTDDTDDSNGGAPGAPENGGSGRGRGRGRSRGRGRGRGRGQSRRA